MAGKIGKHTQFDRKILGVLKKTFGVRRTNFLKYLLEGNTQGQAAKLAHYSPNNPDQSGYQVMKQIRRTMPEVLDALGFTHEAAIQNYLEPALNATETKFFPYLIGRGRGRKQKMTKRDVIAWTARLTALDMLFRLKGSYAPKTLEEAQANPNRGVHVIVVDVPRPPRPVIPAIVPGNGDDPKES